MPAALVVGEPRRESPGAYPLWSAAVPAAGRTRLETRRSSTPSEQGVGLADQRPALRRGRHPRPHPPRRALIRTAGRVGVVEGETGEADVVGTALMSPVSIANAGGQVRELHRDDRQPLLPGQERQQSPRVARVGLLWPAWVRTLRFPGFGLGCVWWLGSGLWGSGARRGVRLSTWSVITLIISIT